MSHVLTTHDTECRRDIGARTLMALATIAENGQGASSFRLPWQVSFRSRANSFNPSKVVKYIVLYV